MHILLIGDVVGNSGCCFLQERLPQLKRTHHVDLTIVNGENSAQGNGITKHSMEQLFSAGCRILLQPETTAFNGERLSRFMRKKPSCVR